MKNLIKPFFIILCLICSNWSISQIQFTLRRSFIDSIKNRVTISAEYVIDKAPASPHAAKDDGDMHCAGRSDIIGLPIVAEIMNAKSQTNAVKLVHSTEGSVQTVSMTGVWRFWCEHAGEDEETQGNELSQFNTTNPSHVFEIHPITSLNNIDLIPSLKPIQGFTYKLADDALSRYAAARSLIIPNADSTTVTIQTNGIGYNYVECNIEIIDTNPLKVEDGEFYYCRILNTDGDVVAQKIRVAFVKNSTPEMKIKKLGTGKQLHVIVIPRIDLALVSFRINHRDDPKYPNILSWNLPFELVAVAVIPKQHG